jgi:hypothetical protein
MPRIGYRDSPHMPRIAQHLLLGRAAFVPALVIFDKGGTLLDFRAMWGEWAADMAQRLAARSSSAVAGRFCEMLGFDPRSGEIDPAGKLAALPMAELHADSRRIDRGRPDSPRRRGGRSDCVACA